MQKSTLARRAVAVALVLTGVALVAYGLHSVYEPLAPITVGALAIAGGLFGIDDGTAS